MQKTNSVITQHQKSGISLESVRTAAKQHENQSTKVPLSAIEIDSNGVLGINGEKLSTDSRVLSQLYKILCLNKTFIHKFGKITNEETAKNLVNVIKSGLILNDAKKQTITLVGNPTTRMVNSILPGDRDFISADAGLNILERILTMYPALHISGYTLDINSGRLSVSVKSTVQLLPITQGGMQIKGEEYSPGLNFIISPEGGLMVDSYVYRYVCDNGAILREVSSKAEFKVLNELTLDKFFQQIQRMADNNFATMSFGDRLQVAAASDASFGELLFAKQKMIQHSSLTDKDIEPYLPEFTQEVKRLAQKGYDYTRLSDRTLSNHAVKGVKVWDIVNRMTDFGSHEYGWDTNFSKVQISAGMLFNKKEFDTQGLILLN